MKSSGQIAYEAYCEHMDWKNYKDIPMPQWEVIRPEIKKAWEGAAAAVLKDAAERKQHL